MFSDDYTDARLIHRNKTAIYRANRIADGKAVILKTLGKNLCPIQKLERFRRECELLKTLQTTGVIRVFEVKDLEDLIVMEMEDIQGTSLDNIRVQEQIPFESILTLMIDIGYTLVRIHGRGVIHRSISPSHIIWNPLNGQARLIDFGLAANGDFLPSFSEMDGDGAYIAPEQTGMVDYPVDCRTDLYALGATFYALIKGMPPFSAKDAAEMSHGILAKTPVEFSRGENPIVDLLSPIIFRLMAKDPDERYRSSDQLVQDLQYIEHAYQTEKVGCLLVAEHDLPRKLHAMEKLYGREEELHALQESFERVYCGAAEIVAISGPVGGGKTELVKMFYKLNINRQAFFVSGKCEQFHYNRPYTALIEALADLVRQILTSSDEQVDEWRRRIIAALGNNAGMMMEFLPNLEVILGPQPEKPTFPAHEGKNRFIQTFKDFLLTFATWEHPLVIFLDDLQWVDSATLHLLQEVLLDADAKHLMVVGAYRNSEVDEGHPLILAVNAIKEAGAVLHQLELQPLSVTQIERMLADLVGEENNIEPVGPLAELCFSKTFGNPFFLNRLIHEYYQRHFISFDYLRGGWRWDLNAIRESPIAENVVDLLVANICRLPEETQHILKLAACLGSFFDPEILASLGGFTAADLLRQLEGTIRFGLITELNVGTNNSVKPRYKFCHDKIQQAAYSLMDEAEMKFNHIRIGRLLLQRSPAGGLDEGVFAIVNHMNAAISLIDTEAERRVIVRLNLYAGRAAKNSIAYEPALRYLNMATLLLAEDSWDDCYDLTFQVYKERIEVELLNGRFDQAGRLVDGILPQIKSRQEKAEIHNLLVLRYTMENRLSEAVEAGRQALRLLGVELPGHCSETMITDEIAKLKESVGEKDLFAVHDFVGTGEELKKTVLKIMTNLISPLMFIDTNLLIYIQIKNVRDALLEGYLPETTVFFAGLGTYLCVCYGDYQLGYQLNLFALEKTEILNDLSLKCIICSSLANYCGPWLKPLRELETVNTSGYQAGLESGQVDYAGFILAHKLCNQFYMGECLSEVFEKAQEYLPFAVKTHNVMAMEVLSGFQLRTAILLDMTPEQFTSKLNGLNEAVYLENCRTDYALAYHQIFMGQMMFIDNHPEEADQYIRKGREQEAGVLGRFAQCELVLYESLVLAELSRRDPGRDVRERIEANLKQMKAWADLCPENFGHKHAMIEAELARIDGKFIEAVDYYDQAIQQAQANGFVQDEAIANELAARFWMDMGKDKIALLYLKRAYQGYYQWGAKRKTNALVGEYPQVVEAYDQLEKECSINIPHPTSIQHVDILALVKSSQVLAEEAELESLIEKMVSIIMENTGSQKCCIIWNNGGKLHLKAVGTVDDERRVKVSLQSKRIEDGHELLPLTMVRYVARTKETVVFHKAARGTLFNRDEYIRDHRPKSIICLPILNKGIVDGVLYLENNLLTNAFTPDRTEVLQLLLAQFAISIENARLHADRAELQSFNSFVAVAEEERPCLQITCFGGFEVSVGEEKTGKIRWRTLKAKELFAYLFHTNGSPISKEKIICSLWPEMTVKKANDLFRTTLYYIRKALNEFGLAEMILHDQTGYTLSSAHISCDVMTFTNGLKEIKRIESQERANRMEELIALYRGEYLDNPGWEWAQPDRTRYQKMAVSAIRYLIEYYQRINQPEKLVKHLERLLEYEPYDEESNELLIGTYAGMGMMGEAKRHYRKYEEMLRNDLDIELKKSFQDLLK
ncbi:MAG TPA: AAA family ATPase [Bacillota bacterium]|nr:AAA family ATPase [Bacillota bacterium]